MSSHAATILQSPKGAETFRRLAVVQPAVKLTIVLSNRMDGVIATWVPVDTNPDGYFVYWGTVSRFSATNYHYPFKMDSTRTNKNGVRLIQTNAYIANLTQGVKYYFAATSYKLANTNDWWPGESDYSNETNYTIPFTANTVTLNWTPAATNTILASTNLKNWTVLTNSYPPVTIPRTKPIEFYRVRLQ